MATDLRTAAADGTIGVLARRLNFVSAGYRTLLLKTANLLEDAPAADVRLALTLVFMVAPILVIIPVSFTAGVELV